MLPTHPAYAGLAGPHVPLSGRLRDGRNHVRSHRMDDEERMRFNELFERVWAICEKHDRPGSKYIGHLGKQDSEYDNELAENAEFVQVPESPLDKAWARVYRLYKYRGRQFLSR